MLRYFDTMNSGHSNSKPADIIKHIDMTTSIENPFMKYLVFNWVKPFCCSNKLLSSVCLLLETNYNFEKCIHFLDKSDKALNSLQEKYNNIDKIFNY